MLILHISIANSKGMKSVEILIEKVFGTWFLSQLKGQGFSITLLVIFACISFFEMRELKADNKRIQTKLVEILENVVEKNTIMLTKVDENCNCK